MIAWPMCTSSVALVPKTCTPRISRVSECTISFNIPYESPVIWPRASSRYREIPTSNGMESEVNSASTFPQ